jgi:putative ATP-dependent endonuclease of OLD family
MRDASSEFSPRSQFWGRILRDLKIDDKERKKFTTELERINQKLLKADSRLEEVRKSIAKAQQIMMLAEDGGTDIQALPAKPWDLMSKAQVVIRGRGTEVDLPLSRHGQGMQSLSVLFLFQAYLDVLLKPQFREETTAILALEEPEAHLHPHASRCLALMLGGIKSQKIISSHSPFFVQEIPFEQIRLFRSLGSETKVLYIKNSFCADLPSKQDLINFCATKNKFTYDQDRKRLTIRGKIEQQEYRDLLTIYAQKREIHPIIKKLYDESQVYLTEDEIAALYTYAKRIRGEILFARGWFLCEGQSEYLLIRYFSELLGKPLDQCGITVIDFMNNGSASAFIGLAKVFEMPWYMLCDNDSAGEKYVEEVRNRGIDEEGIKKYVRTLDGENETLESFLANNGFLDECVEVLRKRDKVLSKRPCEEGFKVELIKELQRDKVGNITTLISILRKKNINKTRVPDLFKDAINTIVKMVNEDGK